jgi:nicotinate-nucleotide adenylyltransferase
MKVDDREIRAAQQGEHNPSFKTLQSLKQERPHEQWVWILGEDQLQAFTSWQRWEWLIQNMALAVCARPGVSKPTKTADQNAGLQMPAALSALGARVTFIDLAADAVSSSQVRANIAGGLAINNLVPQSVANYLLAHPVYRPPEQA